MVALSSYLIIIMVLKSNKIELLISDFDSQLRIAELGFIIPIITLKEFVFDFNYKEHWYRPSDNFFSCITIIKLNIIDVLIRIHFSKI